MKGYWYLIAAALLASLVSLGCSVAPRGAYSAATTPAPPDYSQDKYWAALPWKPDSADLAPDGLTSQQEVAKADVFFLHPTTYSGKKGDRLWNGPVDDSRVNERTQELPIKFQASIFNGVGRIFAPYYRQAHLKAYTARDTLSARKAFGLAYNDVEQAFQYYLTHYNEGRPIILATHSQGTTHGIRLVQDFFDGKPLQEQLVAAYLVGIPVRRADFQNIVPCEDALDTGCFTAWRTYKRGYIPKKRLAPGAVVTNPLLWTTGTDYAGPELNKGAVLRPFEKIRPGNTDAQVHGSILWARKPKFKGSFLLINRNYHAGDYNMYYLNVRENASDRLDAFLD